MKQSKLRRRRVFRYAVLYFVMLVVFVGMIVGPIVAGSKIPTKDISKSLGSFNLFQPTGQNNDDTLGTDMTGTGSVGYDGAAKTMTQKSSLAVRPTTTSEEESGPTDNP